MLKKSFPKVNYWFSGFSFGVPISDNVVNYAVKLAASTRPNEIRK